METRETLNQNRHYHPQGIGTITALLAIITVSLIVLGVLSVL